MAPSITRSAGAGLTSGVGLVRADVRHECVQLWGSVRSFRNGRRPYSAERGGYQVTPGHPNNRCNASTRKSLRPPDVGRPARPARGSGRQCLGRSLSLHDQPGCCQTHFATTVRTGGRRGRTASLLRACGLATAPHYAELVSLVRCQPARTAQHHRRRGLRGWNDAGDAASDALRHLDAMWRPRRSSDRRRGYYDYQVNRPVIRQIDGRHPRLVWPSMRIHAPPPGSDRDIVLMRRRPNMRWRTFCAGC